MTLSLITSPMLHSGITGGGGGSGTVFWQGNFCCRKKKQGKREEGLKLRRKEGKL